MTRAWIIPLLILVLFEAIADILATTWSERSGILLAGGALCAYMVANSFWLFALRNGSGLGRGAVLFSVLSAVIALALGFFLYGERIRGAQAVGAALGVASIVLIFWD